MCLGLKQIIYLKSILFSRSHHAEGRNKWRELKTKLLRLEKYLENFSLYLPYGNTST